MSNPIDTGEAVDFSGGATLGYCPNHLREAPSGEIFVVLKAAADPNSGQNGLWQLGKSGVPTAFPNGAGQIIDDFGSTTSHEIPHPTGSVAAAVVVTPPAAPGLVTYFAADAESGQLNPPWDGPLVFNDGGLAPVVSSLQAKSGTKSYKFEIGPNTADSASSTVMADHPQTAMNPSPTTSGGAVGRFGSGYYSFYAYVDTGFNNTAWNMILGWMTGVSGAPSPISYIGLENWTNNGQSRGGNTLQVVVLLKNCASGQYTCPLIPGYAQSSGWYRQTSSSPNGITPFPRKQWVHLCVYYKMSATNGQITIWQDGVKIMDLTAPTMNTLVGHTTGTNTAGDMILQHFIYGSAENETRRMYVDGFTVTNQQVVPNGTSPTPAPSNVVAPIALTNWGLYNVRTTPTEWTAYYNNAKLYTTSNNTVAWPEVLLFGGGIIVKEVAIYSPALSEADRLVVTAALQARHSLAFAAPGGSTPTNPGNVVVSGRLFANTFLEEDHDAIGATPWTGARITVTPANVVEKLTAARALGVKVFVNFTADTDIKRNGQFDFNRYRAVAETFRTINLDSFIADNTLFGVYVLEEPWNAQRWGGAIANSVVDEMCGVWKGIYAGAKTHVGAPPTKLTGWTWRFLNYAHCQYAARFGDVNLYIQQEKALAQQLALRLIWGLDLTSGGTTDTTSTLFFDRRGPAALDGSLPYSMGAAAISAYGTPLCAETYSDGMLNQRYDADYLALPGISDALSAIKARLASTPTG